jgi:hypothetical protein
MTAQDRASLALFEAIVESNPTPKTEAALEAYRKELVPLGLRKEYQDGSFREAATAQTDSFPQV